jgi:hypothetical protein
MKSPRRKRAIRIPHRRIRGCSVRGTPSVAKIRVNTKTLSRDSAFSIA